MGGTAGSDGAAPDTAIGPGGAGAADGSVERADGADGGPRPGGDGPLGGEGLGSWRYFKLLTLDTTASGANVRSDVPRYPVAVVLTAATFDFSQARPRGEDLRFSDQDGRLLPHAIETWDGSATTAVIWVSVNVKGLSNAQTITMSWGNAEATDVSDSHAVFDTRDGFVGVWHLAEPGSATVRGYQDATANAADMTGVNVAADGSAEGRIGKGASLSHARTQWIRLDGADKNALFDIHDSVTYSIWVRPRSHTVEYQTAFSKGETGFRLHYYGAADWDENKGRNIVEACAESARPTSNDICPVNHAGTDVAPGKWFHLLAVQEHPKVSLYVNGVLEATVADGGPWTSGPALPVAIGTNTTPKYVNLRTWDGDLDEARVLGVAKDASWAKLEYESQRAGQRFLTFGQTRTRF
jgi:biopolymer transport protein ExbB